MEDAREALTKRLAPRPLIAGVPLAPVKVALPWVEDVLGLSPLDR